MMVLISKAHREWAICASRAQTNAPSGPWTATLSTHGDHQKILAHLFARADAPRSIPGAGSESPSLEGGNGPGGLVQVRGGSLETNWGLLNRILQEGQGLWLRDAAHDARSIPHTLFPQIPSSDRERKKGDIVQALCYRDGQVLRKGAVF
ncbi:hypothetical protein BN1708_013625, partial [Verticillium longisporum]